MKIKNKNKKIAKLIFQSCLKKNEIDETKMGRLIEVVKAQPVSQTREILSFLEKLVIWYEKGQSLLVESAYELTAEEEKEIKERFTGLLGKDLSIKLAENKGLVGGVKISNGDFVWENSIVSKLNQLKGALTS